MMNENNMLIEANKIKTFRWLFYISLLQLGLFFLVPVFIFPSSLLLSLEIMAALTLGLIVAIFFLAVNIYGLVVDKRRKALHIILIILTSMWLIWAAISWLYIEHMDYLLN